ncbi:Lrp/AsnC family transcriptional regulator, partial [Candidatus Woesearchaeota archaeon]|nr:Lrp/AsnC family transcriptional regulator [Candidatus Woesearchaeota archaeon]
ITTLHHRIRKLEQNGVIKRYSIEINNKKLGRNVCAYILLKVDYGILKAKGMTQQALALKLKHRDDVEDIALVTGLKDIVLKIRAHNIDELNQLVTKDLRTMHGVKSTETMVVLDEVED